jgi:hypothetical protein
VASFTWLGEVLAAGEARVREETTGRRPCLEGLGWKHWRIAMDASPAGVFPGASQHLVPGVVAW